MESIFTILFINFFLVVVIMLTGWLVSLIKNNVTLVDSLWGLGFILIAGNTLMLASGYGPRRILMALMVTLWGLRLSFHLTWRNWGQGEDPRYQEWRRASGKQFWIVSLGKVFLLQAVFMWFIALSLQIGQSSPAPARLTGLDVAGMLIWGVGFLFESLGDWQLAKFKADSGNKGKVMDRGLWAYTRHPNYFGEVLMWWGLFLMTLATPWGFWTVISPLIITVVLLKMTGIPITEKSIARTRPGYADYVRRTNAFFPWFPKKEVR
jgi:steroid 5-alpha reductase family enzyme